MGATFLLFGLVATAVAVQSAPPITSQVLRAAVVAVRIVVWVPKMSSMQVTRHVDTRG